MGHLYAGAGGGVVGRHPRPAYAAETGRAMGAAGGFVHQPFPTLLFTFCCMAAPALSDMTNRSACLAETGGESERSEVAASVCVCAGSQHGQKASGGGGGGGGEQIDVVMWPLKKLISNFDV